MVRDRTRPWPTGRDGEYGCGLIDVRAALDLVASPDAFAEGSDTGGTGTWSGVVSPSLMNVTAQAAFSGPFGLRLDAAPCLASENVTVPPGNVTSTVSYDACALIVADAVYVVAPNGDLSLSSDGSIRLGAGFGVETGAALQALASDAISGRTLVLHLLLFADWNPAIPPAPHRPGPIMEPTDLLRQVALDVLHKERLLLDVIERAELVAMVAEVAAEVADGVDLHPVQPLRSPDHADDPSVQIRIRTQQCPPLHHATRDLDQGSFPLRRGVVSGVAAHGWSSPEKDAR